jgi:hypothetical protein
MTKAEKRAWKSSGTCCARTPKRARPTLPSASMGTLIHRPAKSWRERLLAVCMRRGNGMPDRWADVLRAARGPLDRGAVP